MGKTITKLCEM